MAGPVPLYGFPQEVLLGIEFDFFFQDGCHGRLPSFLFPFFRLQNNAENDFEQSEES
jgi:hypothetical protein